MKKLHAAISANSALSAAPKASPGACAKIGRRALLGLLSLVFIAACGPGEDAQPVNLARREPVSLPAEDEAITYAYLPQYAHTVSYRRHRRLLDHLRASTGLKFRQVFPDTFDEHIAMVERGEIDISYVNPFVYIRLAQAGARAFVRALEPGGNPFFRGQIICRADDQRIKTLADCRGTSWIAVDPHSAGGYLFPLGLFMQHGLTTGDFVRVDFAPGPGGKQEKVVLAVNSGTYDVGTIREGTLQVVADRVEPESIRVLATTPPYPGWVYAHRPGLDPDVVRRVTQSMTALAPDKEEDAAILSEAGLGGLIPARDEDYEQVRQLAARLGLYANGTQK